MEYINYLQKQNKGYDATFSDKESEEGSNEEKTNNVTAFTTFLGYKTYDKNNGEYSNEELSNEDVVEAYRFLYVKWK